MSITSITKYQRTIDRLPTSARAIILVTVLGMIFIIWYYGFWQNVQESIDSSSKKIESLKTNLSQLEEELKIAQEEVRTKRSIGTNQKRSAGKTLSPHQTKTVLHDLLIANNHLFLLELRNVPPIAAVLPNSEARIFEHGIMIKFLGDYFSTMKYLQEVEKTPWKISWDKLEYRVITHPIAEITLYIHTTSHEDEWIHV